MEIEPGQLWLSRYRIVERLGFGGMGEVWSAHDEALDRMVAVKALARHLVANEDARQRFRREAQLAGSLSHDHVVAVHDAGTAGDAMILVMELVEGGNLSARLREEGALPIDDAVRIATQILSGLSAAHEAGLVHRDVKPANVMFTDRGQVKLTDFGIARLAATETTKTSEVYGSAPYIAPERADGHAAVPASDVYAVGCVLYEMLTGTSPFVGETPAVTIARHLKYTPPVPSVMNPEVTPALDAIVMRSLAKDPLTRYHHAGAMLKDLEHAVSTGQLAAETVALSRSLSLAERRTLRSDPDATIDPGVTGRRPAATAVWYGIAAGLVILLLAVAILGFGSDTPAPADTSADDVATLVPAEPVGERSPSPSAVPSPTPTTSPEPRTLDEAVTAFRSAVASGRDDGELSASAVSDLEKALDQLVEKARKGDDLDKPVRTLEDRLDEHVESGGVTGDSVQRLRRMIVRISELAG